MYSRLLLFVRGSKLLLLLLHLNPNNRGCDLQQPNLKNMICYTRIFSSANTSSTFACRRRNSRRFSGNRRAPLFIRREINGASFLLLFLLLLQITVVIKISGLSIHGGVSKRGLPQRSSQGENLGGKGGYSIIHWEWKKRNKRSTREGKYTMHVLGHVAYFFSETICWTS